MAETKHSPGPWVTDEFGGLDYHDIIQPATDDTIARVFRCAENGDGRANAELIAVAPELLEVVRLGYWMRQAQNAYFRARKTGESGLDELRASKAAEAAFDKAAKAVLAKVEAS